MKLGFFCRCQSPGARPVTRFIALILVLTFILPSLAWTHEANQAFAAHRVSAWRLPSQLGKITSTFRGGERLIVHISDLHCHNEVQTHIAGLLEWLAKNQGIQLIGQEGSVGPLNMDPLRGFPFAQVRKAVSSYFVRQGKLTGAEWYAANGRLPVVVCGLESPELYGASEKMVRSFLNHESLGCFLDLRARLESLKSRLYSPVLIQVDHARMDWQQGRLSTAAYARRLIRHANMFQVAAADLSALQGLRANGAQVKSVFPFEAVGQELDELDRRIRTVLYSDPRQAHLDRLLHRLDIIEKLLNIAITPDELQNYRQNKKAFELGVFLDFVRAQDGETVEWFGEHSQLDAWIRSAEAFYVLADQRSRVFVDQLLEDMDRTQLRQAVMITGGFHSEAVLAELRRRKISFVQITPAMTSAAIANPYYGLLQNRRTPLETLLMKTQTVLALRSAMTDRVFLDQLEMMFKTLAEAMGFSASHPAEWADYLAENQRVPMQRVLGGHDLALNITSVPELGQNQVAVLSSPSEVFSHVSAAQPLEFQEISEVNQTISYYSSLKKARQVADEMEKKIAGARRWTRSMGIVRKILSQAWMVAAQCYLHLRQPGLAAGVIVASLLFLGKISGVSFPLWETGSALWFAGLILPGKDQSDDGNLPAILRRLRKAHGSNAPGLDSAELDAIAREVKRQAPTRALEESSEASQPQRSPVRESAAIQAEPAPEEASAEVDHPPLWVPDSRLSRYQAIEDLGERYRHTWESFKSDFLIQQAGISPQAWNKLKDATRSTFISGQEAKEWAARVPGLSSLPMDADPSGHGSETAGMDLLLIGQLEPWLQSFLTKSAGISEHDSKSLGLAMADLRAGANSDAARWNYISGWAAGKTMDVQAALMVLASTLGGEQEWTNRQANPDVREQYLQMVRRLTHGLVLLSRQGKPGLPDVVVDKLTSLYQAWGGALEHWGRLGPSLQWQVNDSSDVLTWLAREVEGDFTRLSRIGSLVNRLNAGLFADRLGKLSALSPEDLQALARHAAGLRKRMLPRERVSEQAGFQDRSFGIEIEFQPEDGKENIAAFWGGIINLWQTGKINKLWSVEKVNHNDIDSVSLETTSGIRDQQDVFHHVLCNRPEDWGSVENMLALVGQATGERLNNQLNNMTLHLHVNSQDLTVDQKNAFFRACNHFEAYWLWLGNARPSENYTRYQPGMLIYPYRAVNHSLNINDAGVTFEFRLFVPEIYKGRMRTALIQEGVEAAINAIERAATHPEDFSPIHLRLPEIYGMGNELNLTGAARYLDMIYGKKNIQGKLVALGRLQSNYVRRPQKDIPRFKEKLAPVLSSPEFRMLQKGWPELKRLAGLNKHEWEKQGIASDMIQVGAYLMAFGLPGQEEELGYSILKKIGNPSWLSLEYLYQFASQEHAPAFIYQSDKKIQKLLSGLTAPEIMAAAQLWFDRIDSTEDWLVYRNVSVLATWILKGLSEIMPEAEGERLFIAVFSRLHNLPIPDGLVRSLNYFVPHLKPQVAGDYFRQCISLHRWISGRSEKEDFARLAQNLAARATFDDPADGFYSLLYGIQWEQFYENIPKNHLSEILTSLAAQLSSQEAAKLIVNLAEHSLDVNSVSWRMIYCEVLEKIAQRLSSSQAMDLVHRWFRQLDTAETPIDRGRLFQAIAFLAPHISAAPHLRWLADQWFRRLLQRSAGNTPVDHYFKPHRKLESSQPDFWKTSGVIHDMDEIAHEAGYLSPYVTGYPIVSQLLKGFFKNGFPQSTLIPKEVVQLARYADGHVLAGLLEPVFQMASRPDATLADLEKLAIFLRWSTAASDEEQAAAIMRFLDLWQLRFMNEMQESLVAIFFNIGQTISPRYSADVAVRVIRQFGPLQRTKGDASSWHLLSAVAGLLAKASTHITQDEACRYLGLWLEWYEHVDSTVTKHYGKRKSSDTLIVLHDFISGPHRGRLIPLYTKWLETQGNPNEVAHWIRRLMASLISPNPSLTASLRQNVAANVESGRPLARGGLWPLTREWITRWLQEKPGLTRIAAERLYDFGLSGLVEHSLAYLTAGLVMGAVGWGVAFWTGHFDFLFTHGRVGTWVIAWVAVFFPLHFVTAKGLRAPPKGIWVPASWITAINLSLVLTPLTGWGLWWAALAMHSGVNFLAAWVRPSRRTTMAQPEAALGHTEMVFAANEVLNQRHWDAWPGVRRYVILPVQAWCLSMAEFMHAVGLRLQPNLSPLEAGRVNHYGWVRKLKVVHHGEVRLIDERALPDGFIGRLADQVVFKAMDRHGWQGWLDRVRSLWFGYARLQANPQGKLEIFIAPHWLASLDYSTEVSGQEPKKGLEGSLAILARRHLACLVEEATSRAAREPDAFRPVYPHRTEISRLRSRWEPGRLFNLILRRSTIWQRHKKNHAPIRRRLGFGAAA